jgi:hypothetical protein
MTKDIICRLKTGSFPSKNFETDQESFDIRARITKDEAIGLNTYKCSVGLTLGSVEDFDELFDGIGPKKLFKITIEPLPD